jgi:hypothetical protein
MNERKLGKLKFANPEIQNPTKRPFFEEMVSALERKSCLENLLMKSINSSDVFP